MSKEEEKSLLTEATQLLTDIALKGDVVGTHVERASEFVAKVMNAERNETKQAA
jgi:aspartate ammonia-lyase